MEHLTTEKRDWIFIFQMHGRILTLYWIT
uniref:Uncharacterized protein n=1 Tax=Anguilla anguilla TaxID=7936 RepID=A0A0E9SV46_ANGAN